MHNQISKPTLLMAAFCAALWASPAMAASSGYHILKTITLGGDGGWDYLNLDPATGNLFITRGTHVMVVDPRAGKVVGDIPDLVGIHGTAFVGGRAYVTEGGANRVAVVDSKSLAKLSTIPVGTRPDGILYDPASKRIFTFNGGSSDATAVDPSSGAVVGTVALGGKPEAAASDGAGTIFVNIENKNELVAFDANTLAVKAHYPLAPCESPSGMSMDTAHGRIFSVCDGGVMTVADAKTGKIVTTVKIGNGPDASRFDPATGLVFSSNGETGTLTVAHEDSRGSFSVVDEIPTAAGARTMELDPASHLVYVVTQDRKITPPTADQPRPRATVVPGTFRLIVLGR
jgi:YVTN family beta-propeller protein